MFYGREKELETLNDLYKQKSFQFFILYGRRRVGKTTFLIEFCKNKNYIFYSAEQSNNKLNLEKFSNEVFRHYNETSISPFISWEKAFQFICERQKQKRLIIVIDEFPYLAKKNRSLLSELQHVIDKKLKDSNIFLIISGSYMSFMEKEILSSKSPIFGRRTCQLKMNPFDYKTSLDFLMKYSNEDKINLYGAVGGTPLYLSQINNNKSFEENIKTLFLKTTSYLYEEPLLLLRQEVQEPGIYSAIIESIALGYSKANEISTKIGEETAKCIKYINILNELGLITKETPFGEKESSRKTVYYISDFMFRFWYRFVYSNKTLIETGSYEVLWEKKILPFYNDYMGLVFERVCKEYLLRQNSLGNLPILFTKIGRWWGSNENKEQIEIDIIANDNKDYLFCECKWKNELLDLSVLKNLKEKADVFSKKRNQTYFVLFSKSGFTKALKNEAYNGNNILLIDLKKLIS
jgi:AAA+ ATPase superfamily predicted ATPase